MKPTGKNNLSNTAAQSSYEVILLDQNFYKGVRNTLSTANLKKLADFAKTIPEPDPYGTFRDEDHFVKTLELALNSTTETRHQGFFLRR
jgi:hypothetical protein